MKYIFFGIALILLNATISFAFEIDGLSSGISRDNARKILQASDYTNIQTREDGITASGGNRFVLLKFCKDELVLVQKHLPPGFSNFIRLVEEKRKTLGKPSDIVPEPADKNLPFEKYSISIFWKSDLSTMKVTYSEFAANTQLDISYEVGNSCRQVLN